MDFCTYFDLYPKMTQYGPRSANCLALVGGIACKGYLYIICNQCGRVEGLLVVFWGSRPEMNTAIARYKSSHYAMYDAQEHRTESLGSPNDAPTISETNYELSVASLVECPRYHV